MTCVVVILGTSSLDNGCSSIGWTTTVWNKGQWNMNCFKWWPVVYSTRGHHMDQKWSSGWGILFITMNRWQYALDAAAVALWPINTSTSADRGFCAGNSPVAGEFPTQRAGEAENVSIWWRHGYVINKHFTIVPVILLLPILSMKHILMANGRFPYFFVMIFPQVITLMSTLLCFCFCYVVIKTLFAPDFATVTFVLLASNNLCCRLSETFFIMCQWNAYKCCPGDRNNG